MRLIKSLRKKHVGETIYVVGTGPSTRVFPLDFLKDKITIGLNQAYKYFDPTYSITVHPYLIPYDRSTWNTIWVSKVKKTDKTHNQHRRLGNDQHFYMFDNNNIVDDFSYFDNSDPPYKLFVGRGIQTGAIHLACKMGAKYIILIGCDMCPLDEEHHGHDQHIEMHGFTPNEVYKEYWYYTVKCRELAWERYKAKVLSLTPFVGLQFSSADFKRQKTLQNLPNLNQPKEMDENERTGNFISDFI